MELYTKFEEFTKAHEIPQDQLLDMLSRSYGMSAADANAFLFRVREELLVNDVQPIRIADIIPLLGSAKCASRYELDNREPAAIVAVTSTGGAFHRRQLRGRESRGEQELAASNRRLDATVAILQACALFLTRLEAGIGLSGESPLLCRTRLRLRSPGLSVRGPVLTAPWQMYTPSIP